MEYEPPGASVGCLGTIVKTLSGDKPVEGHFTKGGKAIFQLGGGQLFYDSLLDLDSDGSRFAKQDATGQSDTSLHQPNGSPVDSDSVPYFVMPRAFAEQFGIELGDVAAVIFKDRIEFAVLADHGPSRKLGEGSISLHRSLGHETIRGGKFHDEAIDKDVITIVFPGSGNGTPQTPDKIRQIGKDLFARLGGVVS
jgi:Fungal chitosanase of glycosyl hydrolase group 75